MTRHDMTPQSVTIVGEMANAHEGDLATAKEIVSGVQGSADAIKFQVFTADELALPSHPDYETFAELEMVDHEWEELVEHARSSDLRVFADVFGPESVDLMTSLGVGAFKIHNADVSNGPLLERVAEVGETVLLSAGGSTWIELAEALDYLTDVETVLMYGYQNYPTAVEDANLRRIQALRNKFDVPVGYAPHAPGHTDFSTQLPKLAVAAGASTVEVHVTLDRSEEGTDYYSSLEPPEFERMAEQVRDVETLLGSETLTLPDSERSYREGHKKWLVATEEIESGQSITADVIGYKRLADPAVDTNLDLDRVVGRTASERLTPGNPITLADMDGTVVATLACRAESTRLYGKPLQLVGERPILGHLIDRLRSVDAIDDVVLAIADAPSQDAFIEYAREHDLQYVIGSEENVLGRLIDGAHEADADVAVRVTTENPFVYTENLVDLIEEHLRTNCDYSLTEALPIGATVEVASVAALERANEHGEDRHRSELVTLFLVENPDSFTINVESPPESLRRPDVRLTVDNPEDLLLARDVWENAPRRGGELTIEAIVEYLDENPDVAELNAHLPDGTDEEVKEVRPFMYGDAEAQ